MAVFVLIGLFLIYYVAYRLVLHLFPPANINPNGKYVLITGCDSGFGHAFAIDLDKQGFNVLAAVYNLDSVETLSNQLSKRATVFPLDITSDADIDAAFELVKGKTPVLHALVNNAGIGKGGLVDWTTLDFLRETMDVNFFGQAAMTKKFLPLLIARRDARVVNLSSVCGFLASPTMSAYCASKYALEAFSDCLRREMHVWGLHVSLIEPGFMRTPIIEGHSNAVGGLWAELSSEVKERWGEEFLNHLIEHTAKDTFVLNAENPSKVVKALRHAVMNSAPQIRYRTGWQASLFFFPLSTLPAWLTDYIIINIRGLTVPPAGIIHQ